jgi:hypothetical protein
METMLQEIHSISPRNIDSILSHNINACVKFCEKYHIPVYPLYLNYKPLSYRKIVRQYFPLKHHVNMENIQLFTDSIYSITTPNDSIDIIKLIKQYCNVHYIIDGTTNVGSTTIVMSYHFKHIFSCEIDKTTYKMLENNIKVYGIKNVSTFHTSIIPFMNYPQIKDYDINDICLYLDPPWTGPFYKIKHAIDLYLDDINIIEFLDSIHIKYICLRVPFNYNTKSLFRKFTSVQVHLLRSFYIILITK